MNFDEIKAKPYNDTSIEYGIVNGNKTVVFIKSGQDGSIYGYDNKYLQIAKNLNDKFGYTIICSSNPFHKLNPLDIDMAVIDETLNDKAKNVYYMGHSNGALIAAWWAIQYPQIKRLLLINPPLMINWHKTKDGLKDFNQEKCTFLFGEYDPSYKYAPMIDLINNPKVTYETIDGIDHNFTNHLDDFIKLPEKYLIV